MATFAGMIMFGASHFAAMSVIIIISFVVLLLVRRTKRAKTRRNISVVLASVLLLDRLISLFMGHAAVGLRNTLPMHLCDWTVIAAIIALLWHRQLAFEMTYFWGLGGTLQAIVTPDLAYDFPDLRFITFFVSHGCVITVLAFLTLGLQMRPWPWSLVRIFLWSNVYLVSAMMVNLLLGTNYGYLCRKPDHPSLLDYLGPWPLYILSLEGLAIVSFVLCYVPFMVLDRVAKSPLTSG